MKKKFSLRLLPCIVYAVLVIAVCVITTSASCRFSPDGLTMITGDYTSPVLEHFIMTDEMTATMSFSREVTFPRLEYYVLPQNDSAKSNVPVMKNDTPSATGQAKLAGIVFATKITDGTDTETVQSDDNAESSVSIQFDDTTNRYVLTFPSYTSPGTQYILSGTVKDATGSTLTFTLKFTGYNARVPRIIFSEINTEYTSSSRRTEFVEFYVLEGGNLGGMIFQSANDGIENDYVFPAIEVNAGEYVVLHMRSIEEGLVNETGDDLALSAGKHSSAEGRDLWIAGKETRLPTTDVLLLRERLNGSLVDAALYARSDKTSWSKDLMSAYAREAYDANIWREGSEITTAACTDGSTATRTLSRQNIADIVASFESGTKTIANFADDWIVVASGDISPGKVNSSEAYVPK